MAPRTYRGLRASADRINIWGAVVKILYLTDLAQKMLSLRKYSYLCTYLIISAQR